MDGKDHVLAGRSHGHHQAGRERHSGGKAAGRASPPDSAQLQLQALLASNRSALLAEDDKMRRFRNGEGRGVTANCHEAQQQPWKLNVAPAAAGSPQSRNPSPRESPWRRAAGTRNARPLVRTPPRPSLEHPTPWLTFSRGSSNESGSAGGGGGGGGGGGCYRRHRAFLPAPPAGKWAEQVKGCLAWLRRRPLFCPETLLLGTGAVLSPSGEASVRGVMAVEVEVVGAGLRVGAGVKRGVGGGVESGVGLGDRVGVGGGMEAGTPAKVEEGGRSRAGGFALSEACLLVGLDLVEEAVLEEGGGEAAAGLLRAFRTSRGGVAGAEGDGEGEGGGAGLAIGGGGRGQVEGGELSPLVELLEKVRGRQVENNRVFHRWGHCSLVGPGQGDPTPPVIFSKPRSS